MWDKTQLSDGHMSHRRAQRIYTGDTPPGNAAKIALVSRAYWLHGGFRSIGYRFSMFFEGRRQVHNKHE